MATALLAYSGIGVKMLIDQQLGAQLHTMFIVDYQPTAIAHPHDHPFEEAYVFRRGRGARAGRRGTDGPAPG